MSFEFNMAFTGGPFDHDETNRETPKLQAYIDSNHARLIPMHKGKPAVDAKGQLVKIHPSQLKGKNLFEPGPVYLGLDKKTPLFAANIAEEEDSFGGEYLHIRACFSNFKPEDLALVGRANSILNWHFNHQFCAKCGKQTDARKGGMLRLCTFCGTEHFPRINPAVIMLVTDGDKCLMGRGHHKDFVAYSTLAGFVSPGETIEEAVYREVWEETGIKTKNHQYLSGQPWPFPSQLMIGMRCEAVTTKIALNTDELLDAKWVTKTELQDAFNGVEGSFGVPSDISISHFLLKCWLEN